MLKFALVKRHQTIFESIVVGLGLSVILIVLLNLSLTPDSNKSANPSPLTEYAAAVPASSEGPPAEELRAIDFTPNVPSALQVEVSREILCLLTILYTEEIIFYVYEPDVPIRLSKLFFTLFRTVISPNAP